MCGRVSNFKLPPFYLKERCPQVVIGPLLASSAKSFLLESSALKTGVEKIRHETEIIKIK